jgi:hypothetical protein
MTRSLKGRAEQVECPAAAKGTVNHDNRRQENVLFAMRPPPWPTRLTTEL